MASCFSSCLGCARDVGASEDINAIEPTSTLPTYRQIAGAGNGAGSAPARRVPVLFSTNRGLYLRVAQPQVTIQPMSNCSQQYDIRFCDLERWVSFLSQYAAISNELESKFDTEHKSRQCCFSRRHV